MTFRNKNPSPITVTHKRVATLLGLKVIKGYLKESSFRFNTYTSVSRHIHSNTININSLKSTFKFFKYSSFQNLQFSKFCFKFLVLSLFIIISIEFFYLSSFNCQGNKRALFSCTIVWRNQILQFIYLFYLLRFKLPITQRLACSYTLREIDC